MVLIGRVLVMKIDYFNMNHLMAPDILSILWSHSNMKPCFVLWLLYLLSQNKELTETKILEVFSELYNMLCIEN